MKLKGAYDSSETYNVGDVVQYTDGVIYHLQHPASSGTPPTDTLFWGMVDQQLAQAVCLMMDIVEKFNGQLSEVAATIPTNISDEAITLKGTEDAEYLVTVDDSGEAPELAVTLIEEEEAES